MTTRRYDAAQNAELDALYSDLADFDLQPLWEMKGLLTSEPRPRAVPCHWRLADMLKLGARATELVPIGRGGDRRVLSMCNPGLGGAPYATNSLSAGLQFLAPGEVAPAHRHSPGALRFIMEGSGVWTLVDGDPLHMGRGDMILTPSWCFHEHHNPGPGNIVWLDVLDLPIVRFLDGIFYEDGPSEEVDSRTDPHSRAERVHGHAGLVPTHVIGTEAPNHSPLLAYRWADTDAALNAVMTADDLDAATVRYTDPAARRDVMPTMRCEMRRLMPGASIRPERQTGSRVCTVLNGSGTATVGDQRFELAEGDVYVIPSWAPHRLDSGSQTLDVFVTSDAPVLDRLHLYREETTA
jgi:gentisate 1,2-dioxygenase